MSRAVSSEVGDRPGRQLGRKKIFMPWPFVSWWPGKSFETTSLFNIFGRGKYM